MAPVVPEVMMKALETLSNVTATSWPLAVMPVLLAVCEALTV